MIRTFLDAGVLIEAARGSAVHAVEIVEMIDDPERNLLSTSLLELEVLPKAIYHRQTTEVAFYREYFTKYAQRIPIDEELILRATDRAARLGLNAIDCLHLEAAVTAGVDEFITTEKSTKPMFRESALKVIKLW